MGTAISFRARGVGRRVNALALARIAPDPTSRLSDRLAADTLVIVFRLVRLLRIGCVWVAAVPTGCRHRLSHTKTGGTRARVSDVALPGRAKKEALLVMRKHALYPLARLAQKQC